MKKKVKQEMGKSNKEKPSNFYVGGFLTSKVEHFLEETESGEMQLVQQIFLPLKLSFEPHEDKLGFC